MSNQIIEDRQWEELARANDETTEVPMHVELEINHGGRRETSFAKMRRIAMFTEKDESGKEMTVDIWESCTKKDAPTKFGVVLPKGQTLNSHFEMCKYRNTDHGNRLISRLVLGVAVSTDLILMAMMGGLLPSDPEIQGWIWAGIISFILGIMIPLALFAKATTCATLQLECVMPRQERGGFHLCTISNSKVLNTAEQLNCMDKLSPLFQGLITGITGVLNAEFQDIREYAWQLEARLDNLEDSGINRSIQKLDRVLKVGGSQSQIRQDNWVPMILITVIVAVMVFAISYYLFGG